MTTRIVVFMDGGLITYVAASQEDVEVRVVDRDVEGLEDSRVHMVNEREAYVVEATVYCDDHEIIDEVFEVPL